MARKKSLEEFTIEPARPGDEKEIAELIMELAIYEEAPEKCLATPENIRQQLFGQQPVAYAYMVRVEEKVAGFALYFLSFSTWLARPGLHLEDLYVRPEFRKRGIGGALLKKLAGICIEKGYGRMEWTCLEWNELAKSQYRKVGAKPQEEWRTWRLDGDALQEFGAIDAADPEAETEKPSGNSVVIYTDGGCRPNPGVGAWAAVLVFNGTEKELVGGEMESTNNRMELLAAINSLEALKRPCSVEFHTDSQYVKNGISKWIHNWKKNGWKSAGKEPVKNVDLWQRLDKAIKRHDINWKWVKGHAGDEYNERCDVLCSEEIDRLKSSK